LPFSAGENIRNPTPLARLTQKAGVQAIHSYVVEPSASRQTSAMNRGYSSSIPLGSLNWKSQLSEFSESAIKPSMLLAE
jgi:hypothetical protein